MSWYANTLYPVLDEVFYTQAPPKEAGLMAELLHKHGEPEVASFVATLLEEDYDDLKWHIELKQMERERPEDYEAECYEVSFDCK